MFEQPKTYSDMLSRIFKSTLFIGTICTFILGRYSKEINELITSSTIEWDIGPITLPILSVLIPLIIALFSRIICLHDKISNLFKIREKFDINHILIPLARGVNHKIDNEFYSKTITERHRLMRDTFYKYAPNVDKAVINSQHVATALDRWAWFWCFIEAIPILLVSAVISGLMIGLFLTLFFIIAALMFLAFSYLLHKSCIQATNIEVEDILQDNLRKKQIKEVFHAL